MVLSHSITVAYWSVLPILLSGLPAVHGSTPRRTGAPTSGALVSLRVARRMPARARSPAGPSGVGLAASPLAPDSDNLGVSAVRP
jgi:hypothetical protein